MASARSVAEPTAFGGKPGFWGSPTAERGDSRGLVDPDRPLEGSQSASGTERGQREPNASQRLSEAVWGDVP